MRRFVACLLPLAGLFGCAHSGSGPAAYDRQIAIADIDARAQSIDNRYVLLSPGPTEGRFGCSLAVAKLLPANHGEDHLNLVRLTATEEAYWVETLRGVASIKDVQFLSPITVRPGIACTETLCKGAAARKATLLLVYSPNRYSANTAQVQGVLYDVESNDIVSTIHASSRFANSAGVEIRPETLFGDHRDQDAYYQSSRKFERYVLAALDEMIRSDGPVPTTQPHDWVTPHDERWWIPTGVRVR